MQPRLLKLWPQKQYSTQDGGQHPEEGGQGGHVDRGSRKRRQGEEANSHRAGAGESQLLCTLTQQCYICLLWVSFVWKTREEKTEVKKSPFSHTRDPSAPVLASKASDLSRTSAMSLDMPLNQYSGLTAQPPAPEAGGRFLSWSAHSPFLLHLLTSF